MDDLNKERIRFNVEIVKLLTVLFITTGGGGLALVLNGPNNSAKVIVGMTGVFFAATSGILAVIV